MGHEAFKTFFITGLTGALVMYLIMTNMNKQDVEVDNRNSKIELESKQVESNLLLHKAYMNGAISEKDLGKIALEQYKQKQEEIAKEKEKQKQLEEDEMKAKQLQKNMQEEMKTAIESITEDDMKKLKKF